MCFQSQQWNKNDHLKSQVCFRRIQHFNDYSLTPIPYWLGSFYPWAIGSTCDDSPRTTLHARSPWNTLQLVGKAKQTTKNSWKWSVIIALNFPIEANGKKKPVNKSGLQRDSNPWPPRYRCDASPTELWSHTDWERGQFIEMMWSLYEIIYISTVVVDWWKWRVIMAINFPI